MPQDLRVAAKKLEFPHHQQHHQQRQQQDLSDDAESQSCGSLSSGGADSLETRAAGGRGKFSAAEGYFPCSDCGKAYSTSSNLARHRQTHR